MAKPPKKTAPGFRLSNIISRIRGNFDIDTLKSDIKPQAYGSSELISASVKSKILSRSIRLPPARNERAVTSSSILSMVQSSLGNSTNVRLENRKILELMPEVNKAARLMIASSMSPNDLSRQELKVVFSHDSLSEDQANRLSEFASGFFEKKLDLMTALPNWIYDWGYESGAAIFAIIPFKSFERLDDESFIGTEDFISTIVEPVANESLFGFGDTKESLRLPLQYTTALESFATEVIHNKINALKTEKSSKQAQNLYKEVIDKILAVEALSLTDNPSILQINKTSKEKTDKRTKDILSSKFIKPVPETIISIPFPDLNSKKEKIMGDPIVMRLPPESVTVIHTPGDPTDHVGYFILLDRHGNPVDCISEHTATKTKPADYNASQGNIFNQIYSAYGAGSGGGFQGDQDLSTSIYTEIVSEYLKKRLSKAGYNNVDIGNNDSVYRSLFSRFLQSKQTRILFLPKDLVSYMTFEVDEMGYGVSRLEKIKFNLGMKMAVQVSKALASIKAAMDHRKIDIRFTPDLMEQPEAIIQSVIREYVNKSTMSFSIDPNVIQNQIADKSVSIKGIDIPGLEQFDLTNEPDSKTSSVDFDPDFLTYIDKSILNGLKIPASTMNSLNEDDYARSVTTTNLFFAMDVAIDQSIIIRCASDLLRKYARFSETFRTDLKTRFEDLVSKETRETEGKKENRVDFRIDEIINSLLLSLPKPNVAPSKAQFEVLEAMISAITAMVTAIFPDELVGVNDELSPVVRFLRAKFISSNIKTYLDTSGIAGVDVPDTDFTAMLANAGNLMDGLLNVQAMLKDKTRVSQPATEETKVEGY